MKKEFKIVDIEDLSDNIKESYKTKRIHECSDVKMISKNSFKKFSKENKTNIIGSINKNQIKYWYSMIDQEGAQEIKFRKKIFGRVNFRIDNYVKQYDLRKVRNSFISGYANIGNNNYVQVINKKSLFYVFTSLSFAFALTFINLIF